MADRAWLETALPPVFGKEIRNGPLMADTSSTGIGHFVWKEGLTAETQRPQRNLLCDL